MRRFATATFSLFLVLVATAYFHQPVSAWATATQDSGVTPPVVIKEVHPKGDKRASVDFDCVVREDGIVSIIKINKSSDAKLNEAATEAMRQWQFKPCDPQIFLPTQIWRDSGCGGGS
jgi:TonB family protein